MSTPAGAVDRALFAGLVDDAAVFPPGSHPLAAALAARRSPARLACADLVGPLLVPPPLVDEALAWPDPVDLALVGRPEVPVAEVIAAARTVAAHPVHRPAGVELAAVPGWQDALALGLPVAVEVTPAQVDAGELDRLRTGDRVRAKLRTGSTPTTPVPAPEQVVAFLAGCAEADLPFKLTGGLHHLAAGTRPGASGPEQQLGLLGVLLAVDRVRLGRTDEAATLLAEQDVDVLAAAVRELEAERVAAVRRAFVSYGCCEVLDPVTELSDLSLIEETP